MKIAPRLIAPLSVLLLAACGGGGGGGSAPANPGNGGENPGDGNGGTPPVETTTLTRTGSSGCTLSQLIGGAPDQGLSIDRISLLQVVEQAAADPAAILAGNKVVKVRVDVTAPAAGVPMPTDAKIIVGHTGEPGCVELSLTSSALTAPTAIDRQTMSRSFVATIPADEVRAGLTYQVVVDGSRASSEAAANRLYKSESVAVLAPSTEKMRLIPIEFESSTGFAPTNDSLGELVKRTLPQAAVEITTDASRTLSALKISDATLISGIYYFPSSKLADALVELDTHCLSVIDAGDGPANAQKCVGLLPANVAFGTPAARATGRAFIGGYSMVLEGFSSTDEPGIITPYSNHWLTLGAQTFAHEYGHLMTLKHANCGIPGDTDTRLYDDGRLGDGGGYDTGRDFYFLGSAANGFADTMSYCGKGWFSDLGYRVTLNYKTAAPAADKVVASRASASNRTIRLTNENGQWIARFFNAPAFAVKADQSAAAISPALAGLPLTTYATDDAPSLAGPFFVDVTPVVAAALLNNTLPGVLLK